MTFVSRIGERLWGTPMYELGSNAFEAAVRGYLRVSPDCELACAGTTAVFRPRTFVEWNNLRHRIWDERAVLEHLLSNVRGDDVFYDIGANVGIYACLVGVREPDAAVVCAEPYPRNVASLRRNLSANGIDADVVTRPFSDARREARFHQYDTLEAGAQHGSLDTEYPVGDPLASFTVETVAGDELVESGRLPPPTVLKIDVQGTGPAVLDGLRRSLGDDRCRVVYVESHDNATEIASRLETLGFCTTTLGIDRTAKSPTVVGSRDETAETE